MVGLIITFIVTVLIAIVWANGINKMKEQYPDYKGEDFLNWDDNNAHTEDDF
jgi:Na+/citrate or Na+/malate symporter